MNRNWFTVRVKYGRPDQDGTETKVTEEYLINAYSYSEAEIRMYQIIQDELGTGAEVANIARSNYAEVMRFDEGESWWKAKITLVSFDEESGKEKQSNQSLLVQAADIKKAFDQLNKRLGKGVTEFLIPSISHTKILEVYEWSGTDEERKELEERGFRPLAASTLNPVNSSFHEEL